MCGKDNAGKWQAMQEVTEAGVGTKENINPINRTPCTQNGGAIGPTVTPDNDNTNGDLTPGVVVEMPFPG